MKKTVSLSTLILLVSAPVFAEHEFALSLAPAFEIPAGKEHFGPGMGAAAALDWAFLPFMGLSAGGGFTSLSTEAGSAFTVYRGGIGPFFRWRPSDRWTFRADIRAGVYQYQWEDYSNARLFAGGGLRAEFHLLPSLSLYAGGEYTVHAFSASPLNTFNLTAGIRLNLSEIMRGEKTEQRRVFPVSYAWYKDNPAALFEALAVYGMNYVIDPASSFVELSENASAVDSLNYPYQTLYYRGGDCGDLSILYCAMLEALGVDTAFITIPGHIYAAFDTGIESGLAFDIGTLGEGEGWRVGGLIEHGGKLSMPVEITVPDEGFYAAWRIGAREWGRFASQAAQIGGEAKIYSMRESRAVYPPVTAPGAGDRLPDLPEETEIVRRFTEAAKKLGE